MVHTEFYAYSQALGVQTTAQVLLPGPAEIKQMQGAPIPTLYLLHGLSDDQNMWLRNTRVAQYARRYYVAVVMPAANRSFYTDMVHGAKYFTYVGQELPGVMETYFPLAKERAGRFVAGLSMGGYGAMKLALAYPQRYAAAASMSGSLAIHEAYRMRAAQKDFLKELDDVYGGEEALRSGDSNLWNLARALVERGEAGSAEVPQLYISCGTEDDLLHAGQDFVADFGQELPIHYEEGPGYHDWDFWDAEIQKILAWLPLQKLEGVW